MAARQGKQPEQSRGVRPDLGHPVGNEGRRVGGGLRMGRELVQPERRAFGPAPQLGRGDGVQAGRELHGQPDAGLAVQGTQRDLHEPVGVGHDPAERTGKGSSRRGRARGGHERQRETRHLGGADEIVEQAQRDLVDPLDVVHGDQHGTERGEGTIGSLEEPNRLDRARLWNRVEDQGRDRSTGPGNLSQPSEQAAGHGEWNCRLRLVSGQQDPLGKRDLGAGLGQEPTLAAPRVAEDQGHRRPPSAHDSLGQVEDGGQLAHPPHKAPRHRTSSSA